jgi:hypothetical protein
MKKKKSPSKKNALKPRQLNPDEKSSLRSLRAHLIELLKGGKAHISFDDAIAAWPVKLRGIKVANFPHTAWMLLEHMRLAQWDILEFSRNSKHVSPKWPEGYWPASEAPPNEKDWTASVAAFKKDVRTMEGLVTDPKIDLFARIPGGDGQTLLREALLLADHNAYHLGQLVTLRKSIG